MSSGGVERDQWHKIGYGTVQFLDRSTRLVGFHKNVQVKNVINLPRRSCGEVHFEQAQRVFQRSISVKTVMDSWLTIFLNKGFLEDFKYCSWKFITFLLPGNQSHVGAKYHKSLTCFHFVENCRPSCIKFLSSIFYSSHSEVLGKFRCSEKLQETFALI